MHSDIIFIHCQTFARKPNRAGQCVAQVVGEGLRAGAYHQHVTEPHPPVAIYGEPANFQQLHDAHVGGRRTPAIKRGKASEREIRYDRHTLFTIIASYPVQIEAVEALPDEQSRFKRWVDLTLAWVESQYGNQLKASFAHIDEEYPHLHFWLLPDDPSADASLLHPGKVAKRKTEARLKSEGISPREAVAAGNRALKSAMRDWQDSYHRAVGAPLGMGRDGPKRRRLSRAQFAAEQTMLAHYRQLEIERMALEEHVAKLEKKSVTLVTQHRELELKATAFLERAEQHRIRMRTEGEQVAALGPMLNAVVAELEDRTIFYDDETGWRMQDPAPFRAAGHVWELLEPAIRRLVKIVKAAEDETWTAMSKDPEYPPPRCHLSLGMDPI